MDPATEAFHKYRLCARLTWNLFFLPDPELVDWDGHDQFERVKSVLFYALVVHKLSLDEDSTGFAVVPRVEAGVPVKIEHPREGDRNRYWDHPISILKPSDAALEFVDYFDWNPLGYLDFKYVRARIRDFPAQPTLVGREALLEAEYVDILVNH